MADTRKSNDSKQTIRFTQITVETTGAKAKHINVRIGDKMHRIEVDQALYQSWRTLFVRDNPSKKQKELFGTVMQLMVAAYEQGNHDAAEE